MTGIEALRHYDQSEMKVYLNEDSPKEPDEKLSKSNKPKGFATAAVIFGLLAGSIGLVNYFSSQSSSNQAIYRNSDSTN